MWYWLVRNQNKHEQNFQNVCWSYWEKRPGSWGTNTLYIPLRDQLKNAETAFIETQIRQKKSNSNFRVQQIKPGNHVFVFRHETENSKALMLTAASCSCFCHTPSDRCLLNLSGALSPRDFSESVCAAVYCSILASMSNAYEKRLKGTLKQV